MVGNIKEVTFTFENCEHITIDGKYIGEFDVNDIKTSFGRIACNAFGKRMHSDSIIVEIHKDANKEYSPFGQKHFEKTTVFERFKEYNDITHIEYVLVDDDGNELLREEVIPTWIGESDYENEAQKSYISDLGHLYIVIDKNETVDSVFGDDIDDEPRVDFHFDMYDVGDEYSDPHRYESDEE